MPNSKQVVEAYMADFNRMDVDAMMRHYGENAVYETVIKGSLAPPGGKARGLKALRQTFGIVPKVFVRNDFIDQRLYTTPDDERLVMVENTCECEFHNGTIYRNFILYRFEVENGLIQKMTEYVIDPDVQKNAWSKGLTGLSFPTLKVVGLTALVGGAWALLARRKK